MSSLITKDGILFYGPSVVAGCICGVIVNVDKTLLIEAFFIAWVVATIITNYLHGMSRSESFFATLCLTGPMCVWIVVFSMIVSGLAIRWLA
jgi:uncharacterized membrane protein YhdT